MEKLYELDAGDLGYDFAESPLRAALIHGQPDRRLPANYNGRFTLDSSFALAGVAAELRFWAVWQTEGGYDCARILVSSNGGVTWNVLEGRYTAPGSGTPTEQPILSPVLHGSKPYWVEEVMDLHDFVNKTIRIQFTL